MLAKILPLILAFAGTGGGIAAGLFLTPADPVDPASTPHQAAKTEEHSETSEEKKNEFVKISNQFVIPVVHRDKVAAHVVLSLNLEVNPGTQDTVFEREPRLRASFLRVLFDHANMGGFQGTFTTSSHLDSLRTALLETAQLELGEDVIDVLIVDIAKQDTR
ncbi:flagellar basal body-associated protein FliL [Aliisedimentitalea scapharcae]|uniref:Flagellar basal body-associated protein FliL n=1 Tax=Aliisedimentitalea scapharcae TaxID=1524259 RepID=A0ABZ2XW97_9RHOB|nr:flagellar basal body-associated protein FliL [Rhodobacteraceae bacterium M382]